MKVLQVSQLPGLGGGAEITAWTWSQLLASAGHEVIWTSPREVDAAANMKEADRSPLGIVSLPPDSFWNSVLDLARRVEPDVIHIHLARSTPHLRVIFRMCDSFPTMLTLHSQILTCASGRRVLRKAKRPCSRPFGVGCLIEPYVTACNTRKPIALWTSYSWVRQAQRLFHLAARFIVPSQYVADTLTACDAPASKISIVPPFVSASEVPSYPEEGKVVLFAGRLVWDKGLQYLIEASQRIGGSHQVVVAGDGGYKKFAQQLTLTKGLSDKVRFLGWIAEDELSQWYQRATLVVVPSFCPEVFGRVGPEAMAHGCPVVAFDVGGISDWLQDGWNGFLVPVENVAQLAEKIGTLLNNEGLANRMGQQGREMVRQKYNKTIILEKLLAAYRASE